MFSMYQKPYEIVWHDPKVGSVDNQEYLLKLEKLFNKVSTFSTLSHAVAQIRDQPYTRIILISNGTHGKELVE